MKLAEDTPRADDKPVPRVVLLTSPGLLGAEIINILAAAPEIKLVGVGLTNRIYRNKGLLASIHTFRKRTGWRYLFYNALLADVAWTWLRLTGRPAGLKSVAGQVRRLDDVNSPETREWLRSLTPDYVASAFFNQWIGAEVCAIPRRECVNMHPSLLPALRGPDPVFRTLERGLTTTGHTIHKVAAEFDAGAIVHQQTWPVPPGLTAFSLYLQIIRAGADLLTQWLAGTLSESGTVTAVAGPGDYTTFPTPREVGAFFRSGKRLIRLGEWRRALAAVR